MGVERCTGEFVKGVRLSKRAGPLSIWCYTFTNSVFCKEYCSIGLFTNNTIKFIKISFLKFYGVLSWVFIYCLLDFLYLLHYFLPLPPSLLWQEFFLAKDFNFSVQHFPFFLQHFPAEVLLYFRVTMPNNLLTYTLDRIIMPLV